MKNVKFFCEALLLVKSAPKVDILEQPSRDRSRPKCFWGTAYDLEIPKLSFIEASTLAFIQGMKDHFDLGDFEVSDFLYLCNTPGTKFSGMSYYNAGVILLEDHGELQTLRDMEAPKPKKGFRLGARK